MFNLIFISYHIIREKIAISSKTTIKLSCVAYVGRLPRTDAEVLVWFH